MTNQEDQRYDGLINQEIIKLFRESGEASFMVFLDKYIEWQEVQGTDEGGTTDD